MSTRLVFEIRMLSDFHVGSGRRGGYAVDSALLREVDGRPGLRGSTIGQLLRESAREILATKAMEHYAACAASGKAAGERYCGHRGTDASPCPICHVFGSPRTPRRWRFSSAWLDDSGPAPIRRVPDGWGAEAVARVRVSPAMRRAEPDKLFSEEVGDRRLVFRFDAQWGASGDAPADEIAFLAAVARNWRHLGKGRRRGRGHCRVVLLSIDDQPAGDDQLEGFRRYWLDRRWEPSTGFTATLDQPVVLDYGRQQVGARWRVGVVLQLMEPMLVARRAMAANQFDGLTVLPGNVLLGALADRAIQRGALGDPGSRATFIRLFKRGDASFGFLSPATVSPNGDRLHPSFAAPLDVFRCKQRPRDRVRDPHDDLSFTTQSSKSLFCPACESAGNEDTGVKALEGCWTLRGGSLQLVSPVRREELHTRINPSTQRVQAGDLFGYIALESGQYLYGEIVCRDEAAFEALRRLSALPADQQTALTLRLGKATRRGYGLVRTIFMPGAPPVHTSEALRQRLPDPRQAFTLHMLSDTVIADAWGRFPNGFESGWLSESLGVQVSVERGFARSREIDAFSGHLGLPRWRDRALVAGSAVAIRVADSEVTSEQIYDALARAEVEGIGLRRGEGYGRVVVNHPIYRHLVDRGSGVSLEVPRPTIWMDRATIHQHAIAVERDFRKSWQELLQEPFHSNGKTLAWNSVRHVQFAGVARLLRWAKDDPLERIQGILSILGQPEEVRLPNQPLPDVPDRHVPRRPKPFFGAGGNGREGIALIQACLSHIAQRPAAADARFRAIAVVMLAERVAELAEAARQSERKG